MLETVRRHHGEIERLQLGMVEEIKKPLQTHKQRVLRDHFLKEQLGLCTAKQKALLSVYDSEEFRAMGVEAPLKVISSFYSQLGETREYHLRFPQPPPGADEELHRVDPDATPVRFTVEEHFGTYLDLHELHMEYQNLPFNREAPAGGEPALKRQTGMGPRLVHGIDYGTYLRRVGHFHTISKKHKTLEYRTYVEHLLTELKDFWERTQPLAPVEEIMTTLLENFEEQWEQGKVLGWDLEGDRKKPAESSGKEGENEEKTPAAAKGGGRPAKRDRRIAFYKSVALVELKVQKYLELLGDVMDATLEYLQKKSSRTSEELDQDIELEDDLTRQALMGIQEEEVEEIVDEPTWNPRNLPLGFDNKPIPYWLYKLHGLGIAYPCEICSLHVYHGPRAFERHFQDFRHAAGMACLKIPNTRHFQNITGVNDARELWKKIQLDAHSKKWRPDLEEEHE